jgi:hypothetical protein
MSSSAPADQARRVYESAERLVALGVSVIPIQAGAKEPPRGFRWGVYAHRLADLSERYEWFLDEGHQLAVVAGPVSGLLCPLDFDSVAGFPSLRSRYPILDTFPRVRTGSGKVHVWLRTKRPGRKYVTHAPDGGRLEVRAAVHYTVCPPSIHPNGTAYAWEVPPWDGIPVIDLEEIGLRTVPQRDVGDDEPIVEGEALTTAERDHILRLIEPHYTPGGRHELCLALAGWLAGHGVPEDDVLWLVRTLAERQGDAARTREYARGVRNTYRRARGGFVVAGWTRLTDRSDPLISPSTAKQLDLLLRSRHPIFTFDRGAEDDTGDAGPSSAGDASEAGPPPRPWIITLEDLLAEPDEPEEWIADGLVLVPTVNLVCGPAKTYKSLFVQEVAIAVATGSAVFGLYGVPAPRTVVYVQEESSRRALRRRFRAICAGRGMHPAALEGRLLLITNEEFALDDPNHVERFVEEVIAVHQPVLCIWDPLVEMHSANENAGEEMRPILRVFKQFRNEAGISSLVVHHNNKNPLHATPEDSIRGWSGIWAAMDGGIFVMDTRDDARKQVKVRLKEGGQVAPFVFRPLFKDGTISFEVVVKQTGSATVDDATLISTLASIGWSTADELAVIVGLSASYLRRRLNDLVQQGRVRKQLQVRGGHTIAIYGHPDNDEA